MSERGVELLVGWEGFRPDVYDDSAGLPTIGVGHLLLQDELSCGHIVIAGTPVPYATGLCRADVQGLLAQDLARYEAAVGNAVTVDLEQNQFDALVAFCFNVGIGAFLHSTLVKVLNEGSYPDVPDELRQWNKAGGQVVQGLVNRRENEIRLWLGEA